MTIQDILDKITDRKQNVNENISRVHAWRSWYQGYVQAFHRYRIYNGTDYVYKTMSTLHMAKKVCEDWADLLYNEKVQIAVDNEDANIALESALRDVAFTVNLNQGIEKAFALGTVGFVFLVSKDKNVSLESVEADQIYPVTVEGGRVTECAFVSTIVMNQKNHAYISLHAKDKTGKYVVENAIYELADGSVSDIVSGSPKDHWTYETKSDVPWFSIYKPNAVNNFDGSTSFGISVFANAISELKNIDNTYDAINNEITTGRMRIIVATEAMNYDPQSGQERPVFDPMDTVFQQLPKGMNENSLITVVSPQLRTDSQITALNKSLSLFSAKCGMEAGFYIYDKAQGLKTATEVISANSTMFRRMRKHEIILFDTVVALVKALASIYTEHKEIPINFETVTVNFDDSIIQDAEAERKQDMSDMNAGIMSKVEYRMKWYGEDEATAKKAIEEAKSYQDVMSAEGDTY